MEVPNLQYYCHFKLGEILQSAQFEDLSSAKDGADYIVQLPREVLADLKSLLWKDFGSLWEFIDTQQFKAFCVVRILIENGTYCIN